MLIISICDIINLCVMTWNRDCRHIKPFNKQWHSDTRAQHTSTSHMVFISSAALCLCSFTIKHSVQHQQCSVALFSYSVYTCMCHKHMFLFINSNFLHESASNQTCVQAITSSVSTSIYCRLLNRDLLLLPTGNLLGCI